ncbi:MAG: hypothetical protein AB1489_29605, partial [Acidobacteriota bacterium]
MSKPNVIDHRRGEKGESNTKFIVILLIFAMAGYVVYAFMPVYYKVQQLQHDVKEAVRVGAINNREAKTVEKECLKRRDAIDFPEPSDLQIKATKKGDTITVTCAGEVPIKFPLYTYKYKVNFSEAFNR